MRRILFLLMIALLPLRGWVGDAMALQMVLPGGLAHTAVHASAPGSDAQAHGGAAADQHRHLATTAPRGDCTDHALGGTTEPDSHCKTCTVCQTCHTVAITVPATGTEGTEPPAALPVLADSRFASADRAPGFKPPIS